MSIDDIMQSLDAIIVILFGLLICVPALFLIPDAIEDRIRQRRKKKQQVLEQQDRLARPEHWAAIDAQRSNTSTAETITQAKQRLRVVQARYANAHL